MQVANHFISAHIPAIRNIIRKIKLNTLNADSNSSNTVLIIMPFFFHPGKLQSMSKLSGFVAD